MEATIKETIADRINRAHGSFNTIASILKDIPLGSSKVNIGIHLRNVMSVSAMLTNSESWQSMSKGNIKDMETSDNKLLRMILQAQAKTPVEMLHFETGTLPLRFVHVGRCLNYLHSILKRDKDELVRKGLKKQMEVETPGEWFHTILKDFQLINEAFDEPLIMARTKNQHKLWVKDRIEKAAFKDLSEIQRTHSKVAHIEYKKFEMQHYLKDLSFSNKQSNMLFKLRTRTTYVSANTPSIFSE